MLYYWDFWIKLIKSSTFKNYTIFAVCIIQSSKLFWKQSRRKLLIARSACVVALNCLVRSYRSATASQSLGNPERKTLLTFLIWRGWNFFWKRKGCFSFGVLPSKYSGRWRNNADEVLAKLFFGERICQNFGWFVFEFGCRKRRRRGLGRNPPLAPLFSFGEFRAGSTNTKKLKRSHASLFTLD